MANEIEITIVGCGPSAMMIAHACEQMQQHFTMYAPKEKSIISGAQYLHNDVDIRVEGIVPRTLHYSWTGTEEGYQHKIYGDRLPPGLRTSWAKFPYQVEAWPLVEIYDYLWDRHAHRIVDMELSLDQIQFLASTSLVFNTAPLAKLMPDAEFEWETVMIVSGVTLAAPDTIAYNGALDVPWYRSSNLWGNFSIEYPVHNYFSAKMPYIQHEPRRIRKPLRTSAKIPNVIASGRYGRWQKGVLVDESYFQAKDEIKARL